MNLRQVLVETRRRLEHAGIEDASLEAEILLRHVLGTDRTRFFASLAETLHDNDAVKLQLLLERRLRGEPSAYITGHREFFGLDFLVDRRVLIPRPETELLVENAIGMCREYGYRRVADIGTGSGAIAVSLAVNLPEIALIATDNSRDALDVARANAARHGVMERITFIHGDLLQALPGPVDLICANLPYVAGPDVPAVKEPGFEPAAALDGGPGGLDVLAKVCRQAPDYLDPGGGMLLEIGMGQSEAVRDILDTVFTESGIFIKPDLAGIDRLVILRLTQ